MPPEGFEEEEEYIVALSGDEGEEGECYCIPIFPVVDDDEEEDL